MPLCARSLTNRLRNFLNLPMTKILASDFKFDDEGEIHPHTQRSSTFHAFFLCVCVPVCVCVMPEGLLAYKLRFFASPDVSGAKLMTRSREDCHIAAEGPGGLECFPYGEYFPYYEQDVSIVQSTLLNMGYALIAVLLVSGGTIDA